MAQPLPEFDNPPVNEVVLAVQFERLEALHAPQLGCVWQGFRDRFPRTEEHAPIEPAFEQFGSRPGASVGVRFEMLTELPSPRVWFLDTSGTELIQVQQDRFIRNWRKQSGSEKYPRYEVLRKQFIQDFEHFQLLVAKEGWGRVEPNQFEVTYVNFIPVGEVWNCPGELGKVVSLFQAKYSDEGLGIPEEANLNMKFVIRNDRNEPVGRLRISVDPIIRAVDGSTAFRLTLTARGTLNEPGSDGILRSLDLGHESIVRGFASITTPEMHQVWRRTK